MNTRLLYIIIHPSHTLLIMSSEYRTLAAPSQGLYKEKMSKFISFAIPVDTPEEAKSAIADIANKYHDARHVCWAYQLGADGATYMSNDNGEPSGTAGKPILGQIRSAGITNVAIAVVRYFGGIKLGTSGLIVAYREAARLAIEAGEIVTRFETESLTFTFPYVAMNDVMRIAKDPEIKISGQTFDNTCTITLTIRADRADWLRQRLTALDGVTE